jgi:vacuolar-type H+-ATPase subunit H
VETAGHPSASALSAIARHERELLEREAQARQEAKRIVDQARADAFTLMEEASRRLAIEVSALRREGELQRERERIEQEKAYRKRLDDLRVEAQRRVQLAIEAVSRLVLPRPASQR